MTSYLWELIKKNPFLEEFTKETGIKTNVVYSTKGLAQRLKAEGKNNQHLAYFAEKNHNIYLSPSDPEFSSDHPRNREVVSSKGCITTDQIPDGSALRVLYDALEFRDFLCAVLDIEELHEYVDPLSSINLHYASNGQELGWHFDNSSFAITLLIQPPVDGGEFEYVRDVRDADQGDMNYPLSQKETECNQDCSENPSEIRCTIFQGWKGIESAKNYWRDECN